MAEQIELDDVKAQRDVILGTQYNIIQVIQMQPFTPPPDLEKQRRDYLDHLQRTYRALDFKGIPQLDNFAKEMLLEDVYVPLLARPEMPSGETWERRLAGRRMKESDLPAEMMGSLVKGEAAPARVEEAIGKQPQVVVLGDPGSGKSTLLKYLVLRLASLENGPLPILLPLSAYAAALEKDDLNLQAYLPQYFAGLSQEMEGLQVLFSRAIQNGQALILLDGLDEVQSEHLRPILVKRVDEFANDAVKKGCRVALTSRIVGYRESSLASKNWHLYTLLDFDRQAIEQFAGCWCLAFEKGALGDTPEAILAGEVERRSLLEAIDANPGVGQLACNPLLLTILALIKRQGVSLPHRRIELYELYLKTLITAWSKARALDKRPVGPGLDYLQYIKVLGPLALWLREKNPSAGLVLEEPLRDWLAEYFAANWRLEPGLAMERGGEFLANVRRYSNLLIERGQGRYGFIHLTFEEALAARGLVQLGQLDLNKSLAYISRHLKDPAWRETILLAVGVWGIVREESERAGEVIRAILAMDCSGEDACRNVLMAGACLEDVGQDGVGLAAANDVVCELQKTMLNRALPPVTQRDAGFILGRLAGSNPDFLQAIFPDMDEMVQIQPGPFIYQGKPAEITDPFTIGKYPVTNYQYKRFMDAGGYDRQEYWSSDGWAWRTGTYDSKAPKEYRDWLSGRPVEKRTEPFYWHDSKWNNPLAPVVGVSWFEAQAYCKWLWATKDREYRLPTEMEWERAAAGIDGREYPWGNNFDRTKLNCAEFWDESDDLSEFSKWQKWYESESFKAASTTIVSQFSTPRGQEGVLDLSGNVWEWADSWYDREQVYRALRGGSWSGSRRLARCAYRTGLVPDYFFISAIGFRVVSPGIFLPAAC